MGKAHARDRARATVVLYHEVVLALVVVDFAAISDEGLVVSDDVRARDRPADPTLLLSLDVFVSLSSRVPPALTPLCDTPARL